MKLYLFLFLMGASTTSAINCSDEKLVATVSNRSTTDCDGFETLGTHLWPVHVETDYCHGWRSTDPDGEIHDNSANKIRCSEDGTKLLYTQFADTLDCENERNKGGTEKFFELDVCHDGIPSILKDKAMNMDCCLAPDGDSCLINFTGEPSVAEDSLKTNVSIWKNGENCDWMTPGASNGKYNKGKAKGGMKGKGFGVGTKSWASVSQNVEDSVKMQSVNSAAPREAIAKKISAALLVGVFILLL